MTMFSLLSHLSSSLRGSIQLSERSTSESLELHTIISVSETDEGQGELGDCGLDATVLCSILSLSAIFLLLDGFAQDGFEELIFGFFCALCARCSTSCCFTGVLVKICDLHFC